MFVTMAGSVKSRDSQNFPFSSEKMDKVINYIMRDGKKSVAKKIFNDVLKEIKIN